MSDWLSVIYGLASAFVWGSADFAGGVATRRNSVYTVVLLSQAAGAVMIALLIPALGEVFVSWQSVIFGALAGASGAIGLVFFYRGMSQGPMGVIAPVTAMITGGIPVVLNIFREGIPDTWQIAGILLAFPAVWLVSAGNHHAGAGKLQGVKIAVLAGVFFAMFFILIDQVSQTAILYPLAGARVASLALMGAVIAFKGKWEPPVRQSLPLIWLTGILDMGGNAFFALAARHGRLDIAAILAGLGPAVTVLLARIILKERLSGKQRMGVLLALVVVLLLAL